ncbi:aminopeptidase [Exilibacterium tricleocarpae]|uniref:Aminopeptidase n=1 Tax=Exilibacterium tricleocarpae TaxID=2591008 RepID=A0A545TLJ8_9GAMM|nr:aminopeptidase [Exilibacterium tricleocarpae]TQV78105.1 aminopeptidase [Exilibacterium tricleocarpae]
MQLKVPGGPVRLLALLAALALLGGCETLGYYTQAATGQLSLLSKREPIDTLLEAPQTDDETRRQLQLVQSLRAFAGAELSLPAAGSFTSYVELDRDYPVWSVVATPEFSLQPHQWCYPVIGCAAYRGYFKRDDARGKAQALKAQGFDVMVGGVPAYSTLGWFNDPVLSSYLHWREAELAGLIFHELAHQVFYINDDSAINESFATAVEQAGVERWFRHHNRAGEIAAYKNVQLHRQAFLQLVEQTRAELRTLYAGDLPAAQKRAAKQLAFQRLRETYLRRFPDGAYKGWVNRELNNAILASVNTYSQWVPHFLRKLETSASIDAFYASVNALKKLPAQVRYQRLTSWLEEAD